MFIFYTSFVWQTGFEIPEAHWLRNGQELKFGVKIRNEFIFELKKFPSDRIDYICV